ncbi:hypothetical protein GCM10010240_68090 [Streptomyces griseoviridis]|nr:hypothetical protein GCM10010240_68090 [Streptomyces griseoviridis]
MQPRSLSLWSAANSVITDRRCSSAGARNAAPGSSASACGPTRFSAGAHHARGFTRTRLQETRNPHTSYHSAQKVRKQEQEHECVEAKLMSLGAPAPRAGCDPALAVGGQAADLFAEAVHRLK